jgi:hypothetical protein
VEFLVLTLNSRSKRRGKRRTKDKGGGGIGDTCGSWEGMEKKHKDRLR